MPLESDGLAGRLGLRDYKVSESRHYLRVSALNSKVKPAANLCAVAVCALALIFAIGGSAIHTGPIALQGSPLAAVNPEEPSISGDGFAVNAVFPIVTSPPNVKGVELYGSAEQGDVSTGLVRTRWYRPVPSFFLLLCGYPVNRGGDIFLELYSPESGIRPVRFHLDENPENWRLQKLSLPVFRTATKFRIVAADRSQRGMGWLGFSQPFTIRKAKTLELFKQLLLVILCSAASLVSVLGPGIVLRARCATPCSAVWIPIPGILTLTILGLFAWKGPHYLSPELISRTGLSIIFLIVGYEFIRRPLTTRIAGAELRVLALVVLLILIAVAKSLYSIGPSGELYRGHISRTLEANGRGDSRISYHLVQLVALRKGGYSGLAYNLFAPWNFSHRGPVGGLATSPIVLCADVRPPKSMPYATWSLFDPQGFTSYRIAMIVLSAGSLFTVFGLARHFLNEEWAVLAFLCAATAPFTVHELFFTWPKILAASFVLLAAYLVFSRRFLGAGFAVGLGYLCHPSALLSFPAILILIAVVQQRRTSFSYPRLTELGKSTGLACLGLAFWIAIWRWVNHTHFHQDSFFQYFSQAGGLALTPTNWLHARWETLLNTVVPLYAFVFHRTDRDLLPPDGLPQTWVQLIAQYWCTLAFAGGCVFYLPLLWLLATGFKKAKSWLLLIFMPSLLLFLCYFGAPNTGLMREGLHAWFFGLVLFAVVIWKNHLASSQAFWLFTTIALAIRSVEMLFMLVPFSSWSRGYLLQPPYAISDFLALTVMLLGNLILLVLMVSHCKRVQGPTLSSHCYDQ